MPTPRHPIHASCPRIAAGRRRWRSIPDFGGVATGGRSIEQDHLLRLAYQWSYDLRERPPTVRIDAVYDIPIGAVEAFRADGAIASRSLVAERTGVHLIFVFDGHRWRVDSVGERAIDGWGVIDCN